MVTIRLQRGVAKKLSMETSKPSNGASIFS